MRRLTLDRADALLLALVVAIPMAFSALTLRPELSVPLATVNDGNYHFLFVQRANETLALGEHPLDHWVPEMELGFPEFFYYQHLPHLAVALLGRITFGALDLFTLFNFVRLLLLVSLPLTVFWSARRLGFGRGAAAFAGAASPLLSASFLFGLEYESYLWLGYGMYTQLWAVHLAFVALAAIGTAVRTGRGHVWAALALSCLVLTHLAYAYMIGIGAAVIVLATGWRPRRVLSRAASLAAIGAFTGLATAYFTVPFVLEREYLWISPYLPRARWDSYGAERVLTLLVQGGLFDAGRAPVLTVLVAAGATAAVVRRSAPALMALALFAVYLVLFFGRVTLGPLADLLPFHEGLPLHRFIGGVQIAALLLAGYAAGLVHDALAARLRGPGIAIAALAMVVALVPAMREREVLYARNTELMTRTRAALDRDVEAGQALALLRSRAPGRVYAGLRSNWGERMLNLALPFASLRFYDLFPYARLDAVMPPYYNWSANADVLYDFDDSRAEHYDVFDVRSVVAPRGLAVPPFLRQLAAFGPYAVYDAPGAGYATYAAISERIGVASQPELLTRNRAWLASEAPAARRYLRYDFPATSGAASVGGAGCPAGTVREDRVVPGRFDLTAECPSAAVIVLRTTYHPGWRVTVDGRDVPTFMTSPSFIGFEVPAGRHTIVARYEAHALKSPLAALGLLITIGAIAQRRRIDAVLRRSEP